MGKKKENKSHHMGIFPVLVGFGVILLLILILRYPSLVLYEKIEMPQVEELDWCTPGFVYGNFTVLEKVDENYCRIALPDGSEAVVTELPS